LAEALPDLVSKGKLFNYKIKSIHVQRNHKVRL